jgi:hypothetical protein
MGTFVLSAHVTRQDVAAQLAECLTNCTRETIVEAHDGRPGVYGVAGVVPNFALYRRLLNVAEWEEPSIRLFSLSRIIA